MNLGNTCFLNSSLQALYHLQSVLDYFEGDFLNVHYPKCTASGIQNCTLCALKVTYDQSLRLPVIQPIQIVQHLNML